MEEACHSLGKTVKLLYIPKKHEKQEGKSVIPNWSVNSWYQKDTRNNKQIMKNGED